jgi:hypothetical protein
MAKILQISGNGNGNEPAPRCEYCNLRRGQAAMVVHRLKMQTADELRDHLREFYGENAEKEKDFIAVQVNWWHFVHRYYGEGAAIANIPLWRHYLESHGIRVHLKGCKCQKCAERRASLPRALPMIP